MPKITENPNALASIVQGLGGTVLQSETFRFDLPLAAVRDVIPKLNELGLGCRKVGERVGDHPTKLFSPITVATIELFRRED